MGLKHPFELFTASRRGIGDTLVSMAPQIVGVFTGFLGSVLIARGLGPEGLGRYALVMSLAGIAMTVSDLGIGQTAIRYAAKAFSAGNETTQMGVLRWAFRMRMLLVLAVTAGCMFIAPTLARRIWHDPSLTPYLQIGLIGGIFAALSAVPTLYFQSVRRFGVNAGIQTAQRIFFFLGIVLLALLQSWSLYHVLYVQLAAGFVCAAAFLMRVPSESLWRKNGEDTAGFWRAPTMGIAIPSHEMDRHSVQRFALFQMLSTVIVMLILQADVWLMGYFLSSGDIGVYSAAARFALPLTIVLGGLNTALWPRASALHDMRDIRALLKKTFLVALIIASVGAIYGIAAPLLAPWIFGEAYRSGVLIGQLLCLRSCISILICPVGVVGYSFGLVRVYWIINLFQLALVVLINLALLPRLGPLGAAIALVVNEIAGFLIAGWIILRCMSAPGSPIPPCQEMNHAQSY